MERAACVIIIAASFMPAGCSDEPPPSSAQQALDHESIGGNTTVSPQPLKPARTASCPGSTMPDVCGTWEGVELTASKTYSPTVSHDDAHCFCRPIAFQVPPTIPLTQGNTGTHRATFSYRDTSANTTVTCDYKGDAHAGHSPNQTGGGEYVFGSCSNGAQAGATEHGDWFSLSLDMGDLKSGTTVATLRIGAPDTDPSGAPFVQDFYSQDPRILNAVLHVPRGAAAPGQEFSITVASELPSPTLIPNDGDSATSVGPIVDYSAVGATGTFYFNPTTPCTRIELPYSPPEVNSVAGGPGREAGMRVRQVVDLPNLLVPDRASIVNVTSDRVVDPVNQTVSFCTAHLTQLLAAWNSYNALFQTSHYGTPAQDQHKMAPGVSYPISLDFLNTGTSGTGLWLLDHVSAVNYDPDTGAPTNDGAGNTTFGTTLALIGPAALDGSAGQSVTVGEAGLFQGTVVAPTTPGIYTISFCTQVYIDSDAGTGAGDHVFGDCYKTTIAVAAEVCNGQDDDGDGIIDDNVPALACTTSQPGRCAPGHQQCVVGGTGTYGACNADFAPVAESCNDVDDDCNGLVDDGVTQACYDGPGGTDFVGACHDGAQVCTAGAFGGACVGEVTPTTEVCNGADDNCDNRVDEGCPHGFGYVGADTYSPGFGDLSSVITGLLPFTGCDPFSGPPCSTYVVTGLYGRYGSFVDSVGFLLREVTFSVDTSVTPYRYDVTFGPTVQADGRAGGTGGGDFTLDCSEGLPGNSPMYVLAGIGGLADATKLYDIRANCREFIIGSDPPYSVTTGFIFGDGARPGPGSLFDYWCPSGEGVDALLFNLTPPSPNIYVAGIQALCASIDYRR